MLKSAPRVAAPRHHGAATVRLFKPYVAPDVVDRLRDVFRETADGQVFIGEGPQVAAFETELSQYLSAPVSALSSGTAALWLAYELAGIQPGDVVITTPLSCLASTETLLHFGATIRWADVDPETGMIDPEDVRRQANGTGARAVVAVDWGGSLANYGALRRICDQSGARLIADAAHAFGAYGPGNFDAVMGADFVGWSFQAIKALTTGDGGALWCRDPEHYLRSRRLRWFGLDRTRGASMRCTQEVEAPGYKFQMHDIAAAIGRANLAGFPRRLQAARAVAAAYDEAFADDPRLRSFRRSPTASAWLYTLRVPCAQAFAANMADRGVETSPVHARNDTQPIFRAFARRLRGMDVLAEEMVCLPCGWWLTPNDVVRVIDAARMAVTL